MPRLAILAVVVLSSTPALAQTPGDTPVVVRAAEAPRKLGLSLRVGALGLHPQATPEDHHDYAGAGLALSYRLTPRWGLELAGEHFAESVDGEPTGVELGAASISATFHLRPRARWDVYGIAGLDVVTRAAEGTDPVAFGGAHLGAGVERRFRRFGLGAEVRALGLGAAPENADAAPQKMDTASDDGLAGGQLSLAGTYYF